MKLPYIIIRTADLERLEREATSRRFWQRMSEQGDQLMDTALDVIACQRETLEQYEEAMQAMTADRNKHFDEFLIQYDIAYHERRKANEWRNRYDLLAAEAIRPRQAAEATTKPAEPAEQGAAE